MTRMKRAESHVKNNPRIDRSLVACLFLASFVTLATPARSAPSSPAKSSRSVVGKGRGKAAMSQELLAKLRSDDVEELRAGLADARSLGPKAAAAAAPIMAQLGSGLPYGVAQAAIETLADLESPDSAAAIAPYARHRDLKVRRAAVKALGKAVGASTALAATTLRSSLSDPDSQVRAAAATGLGALKAKVAVKDLFLALDRHVYEAADSIGQLCDAGECQALAGNLGKIPFDVMTTGLDQMLFRPASEVSDDVKVGIVTRVRDLGTRDANKFLRGVQSRWPRSASARVKKEIDAGVAATLSSPGSDP
jgi:hypothetical protein